MLSAPTPPSPWRAALLVVAAAWCVLCLPLLVHTVVTDTLDFRLWRQQPWPWVMWLGAVPFIVALCFRLPVSKARPRRLLVHLLACAGLVAVGAWMSGNVLPPFGRWPGPPSWVPTQQPSAWFRGATRPPMARGVVDAAFYGVLMIICQAVVNSREARQREQRLLVAEADLARARLNALQMQLQPHFLFNALNGLAGLIPADADRAGRMLNDISDLLRASLDAAADIEVPLRLELAVLRRYVAIEQTRFGDRLRVSTSVPDHLGDVRVPTLLLQPLVENAIHHGIERSSGPGWVEVAATHVGNSLEITVRNSGSPTAPRSAVREGHGIGLANSRARLEQLYGSRAGLVVVTDANGDSLVTVHLPLRSEA